jgi:hypothetical protein
MYLGEDPLTNLLRCFQKKTKSDAAFSIHRTAQPTVSERFKSRGVLPLEILHEASSISDESYRLPQICSSTSSRPVDRFLEGIA